MEDWLKCQISTLVKYRQNQNQNACCRHISFVVGVGGISTCTFLKRTC